MKRVFVFPGQGTQREGMLRMLDADFEEVRDIFEMAGDISHRDVIDLCRNQPDSVLSDTSNTQIAVTAMNLSFLKLLENRGVKPEVTLGQSLGELSAVAACGAMSYEDVLKLVWRRSEMMAGIKDESFLYVLIGPDVEKVSDAIAGVPEQYGKAEIALINSDIQVVIGGPEAALDKAVEILGKMCAFKVVRARVDHAFHTSCMNEIRGDYDELLNTLSIHDPECDIILNCSAILGKTALDIRKDLSLQPFNTVLWRDSLKLLFSMGDLKIAEVGAGRSMSAIIRSMGYKDRVYAMSDRKDLEGYLL